jgi:predicted outer membrane protein
MTALPHFSSAREDTTQMPQRRCILAAATAIIGVGLLVPARVDAQASLRPDPTPRLPPQPGQGLPAEDVRFLQRAARLTEAQSEAGRIAAERASSPDVRRLASAVADENARRYQRIVAIAAARKVVLQANPAEAATADPSLAALRQAAGEAVDRRFLARQLGLYPLEADLYQTEASNSPDRELSRLGIEALAVLRQHVETAQALGAPLGIQADAIEAPPQY